MGQKTHPVGFRLGISRLWDANWYDEKHVAVKLSEDLKIRAYVFNRLKKASVSRISIDRRGEKVVLMIFTSRPGVVIGKSGKEI
ncbi:MAG TPA: KH domain-containing protein, partial [Candidatus Kapabacteria bacterium]|nr:KH domain-containing protein [Candidatus Kapabacteria bacterium]